ncbi:MAG: ATP-dependent DNA helicase RecG [Ruminococcaceae bacterium]|nr:ATP-dependent DNA helicase RecG [Oscillospiraceae bacterium]
MTTPELTSSITVLSGVGEKRAAAFSRLGIVTLADLLSHYPRAYENRENCKKIIELSHEETVSVRGVVSSSVKTNIIRKNLRVSTVKVSDGTGFLEMVWFNNRFIENRLKKGETYVFYGKVQLTPKKQMHTPIFERPEEQKQLGRIMPIYPLTEGITASILTDCVARALDACRGQIKESLPAALRNAFKLCEINFALENIHFPANEEAYRIARRRLAFEELFLFQTALFSLKKRQNSSHAPRLSADMQPFLNSLPFTPTGAQRRVMDEIGRDVSNSNMMNRLICGDVGSGKTVVAAAAVYMAVKSGFQVAFMAPTEILAAQHYNTLQKLFAPHNITVELLSGSLPARQKRETLARIQDGTTHLVVGTHALLSDDVAFNKLGLAVTDEQHRFGVEQRRLLTDKGENPHVLVMSATPIPRTLALIIYGDLDVSVIDELPPGRQKIDTFAVGESYRKRIYDFLKKEISQGRQAYIVCPLVEESDVTELQSVTAYIKKLEQSGFPAASIGILHGKLKGAEKDAVMSAFKEGRLSLLVATTVIEVGVDVPNATIMLIENAERFGLSQLHQLRGRVGRGSHKSYCILLSQSSQNAAMARLSVMKKESDGFKIAEEDLKQRGPGEFFGTRQHGLPAFRIASLYTDMALLEQTTKAARDFLNQRFPCSDVEKKLITEKIDALFNNHVTIN